MLRRRSHPRELRMAQEKTDRANVDGFTLQDQHRGCVVNYVRQCVPTQVIQEEQEKMQSGNVDGFMLLDQLCGYILRITAMCANCEVLRRRIKLKFKDTELDFGWVLFGKLVNFNKVDIQSINPRWQVKPISLPKSSHLSKTKGMHVCAARALYACF